MNNSVRSRLSRACANASSYATSNRSRSSGSNAALIAAGDVDPAELLEATLARMRVEHSLRSRGSWLSFDEWWTADVLRDTDGLNFTRAGLVEALEDGPLLFIAQKDFTRFTRAFPFLDKHFTDYIEKT